MNSEWAIIKGKIFEVERIHHQVEEDINNTMSAYQCPEGMDRSTWVAPPMPEHTKGYLEALQWVRIAINKNLRFLDSQLKKIEAVHPPPTE